MDELISRRAAIEEIARRDTTDGTVKVYSGREVCDILNALPTAEQRTVTMKLEMDKDWVKKVMEEAELTFFAEPKKGKWVPYEFGDERWHKCTACGTADQYKTRVERDNGEVHYLTAVRNYCPICGARMEESDGQDI